MLSMTCQPTRETPVAASFDHAMLAFLRKLERTASQYASKTIGFFKSSCEFAIRNCNSKV